MNKKQLLISIAGFAATLFADEIRLDDGGMFNGTICSISETHIEVNTAFAGVLKVDRARISGFSVDNPLFVRLQNGEVLSGTISNPESGELEIAETDHAVRTPLTSIRQGWLQAEKDPERVAEPAVEEEAGREWKYRTVANFSGKSGNSDEKRIGIGLVAKLVGEEDELRFNGAYDTRESNGEKSSDRRKFGTRYTSYFNDPWGWYVRQEFEDDKFKNLRLRSMSAAGFSYRQKDKKKEKLALNLGVSYRHETYVDNTQASSNFGLDLGLNHSFGIERRFELHNELTMVPSAEDLSNYLISQESYLDMPINSSRNWKLRLGLENDYNSQPTGGRVALDSRYYSSFVAEWD